jgi:GNAT superfamily N-acetyltransferase
MTVSSGVAIRPARPADVADLWRMIGELAVYERLEHERAGSAELLERHLFGTPPAVEGVVAEEGARLAGYALFFPIFSSFRTGMVAWLDDLYVRPEWRAGGVGRALLAQVASRARANGWLGVSWMVLDWNQSAIGFYQSLGAQPVELDWTTYLLADDAFERLAGGASGARASAPGAGG